ncbi:MAG: hypothetical protein ABIA04_01535 [Pseudomonadota bacterium]
MQKIIRLLCVLLIINNAFAGSIYENEEELMKKCIANNYKLKSNENEMNKALANESILNSIRIGSGFSMFGEYHISHSSSLYLSMPLFKLIPFYNPKSFMKKVFQGKANEVVYEVKESLLALILEYRELKLLKDKTILELNYKKEEIKELEEGLALSKLTSRDFKKAVYLINKLELEDKENKLRLEYKIKEINNFCGLN